MFCRECGKEISSGSNFCMNCGSKVTYTDCNFNTSYAEFTKPQAFSDSLWSPLAIVLWSLFFGPVWGTVMAELNQERLVNRSGVRRVGGGWVFAAFIVNIIINSSLNNNQSKINSVDAFWVAVIIQIAFTAVWYMVFMRNQIDYVRRLYGTNYSRRSWVCPVTVGVGLCIASLYLRDFVSI